MVTFSEMFETLTESKASVIFTKKNGNLRHMFCTLNLDEIPFNEHESILTTISNLIQYDVLIEIIPVWDLEHSGWRSFRIDSVMNFNKSEHGEVVAEEIEDVRKEREKISLEEASEEMIKDRQNLLENFFEAGIERIQYNITNKMKGSLDNAIEYATNIENITKMFGYKTKKRQ
jgi:hypothetical protein|tara:strand:+ start:347 stop:868 length:522 start_codon:yes stop_codon:yes gene_type:complete